MPSSFRIGRRSAAGSSERLEPVLVGLEQLAAEVEKGTPAAPKVGVPLFPAADGERPGLGLQIEDVVGIAQRRQAGRDGVALLGDHVLVLDGAGRHLTRPPSSPTSRAQMPAALTTISQSMAPWSVSTRVRRRPSDLEARHQHALDDAHAARARALGIGHASRLDGLDRAVVGHEHRADDARRSISGNFSCASLGDSVCSSKSKLRAVVAMRLSSLQRSSRGGEPQAADRLPFRRLAGLRLRAGRRAGRCTA